MTSKTRRRRTFAAVIAAVAVLAATLPTAAGAIPTTPGGGCGTGCR